MPLKLKVKIRNWSFERFTTSVKKGFERAREDVKYHDATAKRCYDEKFQVWYTVVTLAKRCRPRGRPAGFSRRP
jgi:hypothetical protein